MTDEIKIDAFDDEMAIKKPDLSKVELPDNIKNYIEWLEGYNALLYEELIAKPGAEARGIAWVDTHGLKEMANGLYKQVRINFTQRSDVSGLHAYRLAFEGLRAVIGDFRMTPWLPDLPKPKNGQTPAPTPTPEPAPQASEPAGETRERSDQTPAPSKTPQAIGPDEKWYAVKSLHLKMNQDGTDRIIAVRCGKWHLHGVTAYLDSANVPQGVLDMIEKGEWTTEQTKVEVIEIKKTFPDMQFALVASEPIEGSTKTRVKVVGFSETLPQ